MSNAIFPSPPLPVVVVVSLGENNNMGSFLSEQDYIDFHLQLEQDIEAEKQRQQQNQHLVRTAMLETPCCSRTGTFGRSVSQDARD